MNEKLAIWTIYDKPRDYPNGFIARKFLLDQPTDKTLTDSTLDGLRAKLPIGLYCLGRESGDHPNVVESWV
jgi:hypothetical protein